MLDPIQERQEQFDAKSGWAKGKHRLAYYFGEFCIYSYEFPVMADSDVHFFGTARLRTTSTSSSDAIRHLEPGIKAVVQLSQPVIESSPRIRIMKDVICYVPMESRHYYIQVDGSFEDYVRENFRAKPRHNMRRSIKLFETFSGGALDIREFRAPNDVGQFYDMARRVSRLTYQERMLKLGLPTTTEFTDLLKRLAERGELRGYVLFHQGLPVAYAYCRIESGVMMYKTIGHDPAYSKWSPGKILLYFILERVFDKERVSIFDFGPGEAHYKSFFSSESRICADRYYFRKTAGNFVRIALHAGLNSLSGLIGLGLARLHLKERIRKFLRHQSSRFSALLLINLFLPIFSQ